MNKKDFLRQLTYIQETGDYSACDVYHSPEVYPTEFNYEKFASLPRRTNMVIGFIAPECAQIGDTYKIFIGIDQSSTKSYMNVYNNNFVYYPIQQSPLNSIFICHEWSRPINVVGLQIQTDVFTDFCNQDGYLSRNNIWQQTTKETYKNYHNMSFIPRDAVYQLRFCDLLHNSKLFDPTIFTRVLDYLYPI